MNNLIKRVYPVSFNNEVPYQGKITSHFGMRPNPVTGLVEKHTGVDIAGKKGTPIKCPENSRILVCKIDPKGLYGNYVVIKTDSGVKWQCWHLEGFVGYANIGDNPAIKLHAFRQPSIKVLKGQVLGFMGSTGKFVTGVHAHIRTALYPDTRVAFDPLEYYGIYNYFKELTVNG